MLSIRERRLRVEQMSGSAHAGTIVAQDRLDGLPAAPSAHGVGRSTKPTLVCSAKSECPTPSSDSASLLSTKNAVPSSTAACRNTSTGTPWAAVHDGRNIHRARQQARGAAGIDVPARFHALAAGRHSLDPIAGRLDIRHALPDELRAGAYARSKTALRARSDPRAASPSRSGAAIPRMTGGGAAATLPAEFVDGDLLLVGGDAVQQRVGVNPEAPEQAWARPVERLADLVVRMRPHPGRRPKPAWRSRMLAVSPAIPAPMTATS